MDSADLADDALVDLVGEALRPGFAGVPSARDFAMAEEIVLNGSCILQNAKSEGLKRFWAVRESKQWECGNVLQRNQTSECGIHPDWGSTTQTIANKFIATNRNAEFPSICAISCM